MTELPYWTYPRSDDPREVDHVILFRSEHNVCPDRDRRRGRCDTTSGFYYGWHSDQAEPYCPRHFYWMHFRRNSPREFEDDLHARWME